MASTTQYPTATPVLDSGIWPKGRRKNVSSILTGFLLAIPFVMVLISVTNQVRRFGADAANFVGLEYLVCFALAIIVHERVVRQPQFHLKIDRTGKMSYRSEGFAEDS